MQVLQAERFNARFFLRKHGALIVMLVVITLNSLFTRNFFHVNTLWNAVINSFPVLMVALGIMAPIASGGIDISSGSTLAIVACVVAKLLRPMGAPTAVAAGLLAGCCIGVFIGFFIAWFNLLPLIMTLILMISGRGLAQLVNNGATISFYGHPFVNLGTYRIGGQVPIQAAILVIAVLLSYFLFYKTRIGRYVLAIGGNASASRLSGANVFLTTIFVYVVSAAYTSVGAVIETARLSSANANVMGVAMELDAITAVVVGGTPIYGGRVNILGTVYGAVVMQLISITIKANNIPFNWSLVFKAIVLIVAVYLQSEKKD